MANRKYIVTGPFPAYGTQTGDPVTLDADDPLVQINATAGLITLASEVEAQPKPDPMPCPACTGQGAKKVPTFASWAEMDEHYIEQHPGLVKPERRR